MIENFCRDHHIEFKKYYNYLNNPFYLGILSKCLEYIDDKRVKDKIYKMIVDNHTVVIDKLDKIDTIIHFYKQNNLINKSEIGNFFKFYEIHRKKTNVKNNKDLLKLFYTLIKYPKCIAVLKECFYIFSDYRACIYFMTPSINFYDTTKPIIDKVVLNFRDNLNTLSQIISKTYIGDKNPWGRMYSTAYATFETFIILNKYYKDPLKKLKIDFKVNKRCNKNKILHNLLINYKKNRLTNHDIKKINNVSDFILKMKRFGYDLWFVIPLVFNTIYTDYHLNGIMESDLISYEKIYFQKMNNKIAIMAYILTNDGFITNTNIFKNFNE
jgi:hypothetical protein